MTPDEHEMIAELHSFLMKPRAPGKKTRAEELDDLLGVARDGELARLTAFFRAGRVGARAILWLAGFVAAVGAAWAAWKTKG